MSGRRRWEDDDRLVTDLHTALLSGGPVPELFRQQALSAYRIGHTGGGTSLAELVFDSACDPQPTGQSRAAGPARLLAFRTHHHAIDIEVTESGLVGQVYPIDAVHPAVDEILGQIAGETPYGIFGDTALTEMGGFELPLPAPGPMRLRAEVAGSVSVTSWLVLRYPR
jgi:hypothetical protein